MIGTDCTDSCRYLIGLTLVLTTLGVEIHLEQITLLQKNLKSPPKDHDVFNCSSTTNNYIFFEHHMLSSIEQQNRLVSKY